MKKTFLLLVIIPNVFIAQQHRLDSVTSLITGESQPSVYKCYYNANNKLEQSKEFEFHSSGGHLHYPNTLDFDYNSNNQLTRKTAEYASYDSSHILSLEKEKKETSYNSNNEIDEIISYELVSGLWGQKSKLEYIYSSNNQLERVNSFLYQTNNWVLNAFHTEYYSNTPDISAFFSNGIDTTYFFEEIYNSNNQVEERNFYGFTSQIRELDYKEVYYYNLSNQLEKIRYYDSDGITPDAEVRFEYESGINFSDVIIDLDNNLFFTPGDGKVLKSTYYEFNNGSWDLYQDNTYHYQKLTSIVEDQKSSFFIYPNPVNNNNDIYITFKQEYKSIELRIIDALGRTVISEKRESVSKKEKLPTKNLEKGVYFISIKINNELLTKKLIIE